MPRRVSDFAGDVLPRCWGCDVENRQERAGGSPLPATLSANDFQICSVLEFLSFTRPGGADLANGCYYMSLRLARSGRGLG